MNISKKDENIGSQSKEENEHVRSKEIESKEGKLIQDIQGLQKNSSDSEELKQVKESSLSKVKIAAGVKLISYIEKTKMKDDMCRLIASKINQLRTYIEMDYHDKKTAIKSKVNEEKLNEENIDSFRSLKKNLDELCTSICTINDILINIRSCNTEFTDMNKLKRSSEDYLLFLMKSKPNVLFASDETIKRYQDKISLSHSIVNICNVFLNNIIWSEYLKGNFIET